MTFMHASASQRERDDMVLSADNYPDRFTLIEIIRQAAPLLGLKPPVLSTLDAMLSFLPPRRCHNTVFASNTTLVARTNGTTDRTLRRHFAILEDLGFLTRVNSPNRKRFTKYDHSNGQALRFGFDLNPLFERFHQLSELASDAKFRAERVSFLRAQLRAAAHAALTAVPGHDLALVAQKMLRRNLSAEVLETLLSQLPSVESKPIDRDEPSHAVNTMSGSDGQNVRHHHKSNKELIDKKASQTQHRQNLTPESQPHSKTLHLATLLEACPEAVSYATTNITTEIDVVRHARTLAPMMGIDNRTYHDAEKHLGQTGAAISVWIVLQFHQRVRRMGAYFRALTLGERRSAFDPWNMLARLGVKHAVPGT